jgi:glutamate formiminotransferase/formiminotetrahydrofolate cyclodeaminase
MGLMNWLLLNRKKKLLNICYKIKMTVRLVSMPLNDFADETASESPAPGGGSIAAYIGSLGVSLATMVANLSSHKKGWDERWEEFSNLGRERPAV